MANNDRVEDCVLQEMVDMLVKHGGVRDHAAKELGMSPNTFKGRIKMAEERNITPSKNIENLNDINHAKLKIKRLEAEVNKIRESTLDEQTIRETILNLSSNISECTPPDWIINPDKAPAKSPGVPTLFASDWHLGEVVSKSQIGGVNEFSMKIAKARAQMMIERTLDLLNNHMVNPKYPGIVFALGGDMVSGDIHEELSITNELMIMPVLLELFSILCWCIERLVETFGKIFIPCVSGNHGRNTKKIYNKGRNHTSFDWLVYSFLAKRFESDKRVTFYIPDGPDAYYKIYNHKYLLTHGDKLGKGGDGIIGAIGPIIRGDVKKRSRNAQIDQEYDTLMCGHFHQLMMLERVIVNGSLKDG